MVHPQIHNTRAPSMHGICSLDRNLDGIIGKERFASEPDEDKLVELEALRDYLKSVCEAIDAMVNKTGGAKERQVFHCAVHQL